jgi:hypothetical protein
MTTIMNFMKIYQLVQKLSGGKDSQEDLRSPTSFSLGRKVS